MPLKPDDLSIGVTMYRRLEYLEEALDSAVNQTVPVKVILYDDGCQDPDGLNRILSHFGDRLVYHKNPRTLGLFQNMNQCIWKSPTPWLSILHDDDALSKDFAERILEAAPAVGECDLFFGGTSYMNSASQVFHRMGLPPGERWRRISATEYAWKNWFSFPGQLMRVEAAQAAGGFPEKSIYTGDWELWFRLAHQRGAVQLGADLARHRAHLGGDRGTTAATKTGRKVACCAMQVKRNLARLRTTGAEPRFDRRQWLRAYGPLYRDLLVYSWKMPGWLLRYNRRLLLISEPAGRISRWLNQVSRWFGNPGIRLAGLARSLGERLGYKPPQTF